MANEKRLIDATPNDCIKKTKRKTNFAKIIVSGTADKPYYEIMWFDYMDRQYHIGYGSYNLDFVFQWLSECFEVEDAPTVDAVEVVHGRWVVKKVKADSTVFNCSKCSREIEACNDYFGKPTEHIATIYPYCHCGAKMDGDGNV